jgi:hypothetical protein
MSATLYCIMPRVLAGHNFLIVGSHSSQPAVQFVGFGEDIDRML